MFQAYSLNTLTDVQRIAIRDLAELGSVKLQQVLFLFLFFPQIILTIMTSTEFQGRKIAGSFLPNWLQISQQSLSDSSSSKEVAYHILPYSNYFCFQILSVTSTVPPT
jgi:hypothetical protein